MRFGRYYINFFRGMGSFRPLYLKTSVQPAHYPLINSRLFLHACILHFEIVCIELKICEGVALLFITRSYKSSIKELYIWSICSCIFFLHQAILQQSYIVESVLFQLFSLTFFYCRELVFSYQAIDTSSTPVSLSCPDLCKILDYEINLITPVWLGGEDWWISNKSTSLTFRSPTISAPQM